MSSGIPSSDPSRAPGSGGLVAVDAEGNVAFTFNTAGMYRGWIAERGRAEVAIYLDD